MKRGVSAVDLMLLGTVVLWALNVTVTKYVFEHGFQPLAYGTTRYVTTTALFWGFTWHRERSFRVARADWKLVGLAALFIFGNQLCFVLAIHLTAASTVGLLMGTTPICIGIVATLVGLERPNRAFWIAALVSFAGVGLIAGGAEGGLSSDLLGDLLGVGLAASWAAYSVTIAPLMRRYSPFRISALVLALSCVPLTLTSIPQLLQQGFSGFGWKMWLAFAFAVLGPLFLTNILWFTAIARVGPSRAGLFVNLQPFLTVLFAMVLLSEHLNRWEVAGGLAIAGGIALERWRRVAPAASPKPVAVGE